MNVLITNIDDEVEYLATCAADCQGADLLAYQMVCLTKRGVCYSGGRHGESVMIAEPTGAPITCGPPRRHND